MRDSTVLTFRTTALLVLLAWPELGLEGGSVSTARAQAFVDRDDASVAFEHPAYTPRLSDFDLHPELDPRPIIGILSQPVRAYSNETYFAGSYSSYMRMAGARTMPVRCDSTKAELRDIFSKINGLLVPGGSQDLRPGNQYYDAQSYMMDLAMEAYDRDNDTFPIHYTCLGWEAVAIKVTNNPDILANFTSENMAANLDWTDAAPSSRILQLVSPVLLETAALAPIAFEAHHFGIWLPDFEGTALAEFFTLLSTTRDRDGKVYASTMEAKNYPIIALQWHPEKASFEWSPTANIPHSLAAVQLAQAVSNQFVEWGRLSKHKYPTKQEEDAALLENYQPIYTPDAYFDQVYSFPRTGYSTSDSAAQSLSITLTILSATASLALLLVTL